MPRDGLTVSHDRFTLLRMPRRSLTPPQPLLTKAQVAELLNVSTRTVDRWTDQGLLPAVKMPSGHAVRYRREDVDAIMRGQAS